MPVRVLSIATPCVPIWVATLYSSAVAAMTRASWIVRVSGFSQYTCLPSRIAETLAGAWVWSGVATMTASNVLASSSSVRQSV